MCRMALESKVLLNCVLQKGPRKSVVELGSSSSLVIFEISSSPEFVSEVCWWVQLTSASASTWHLHVTSQHSLKERRNCPDTGGTPPSSHPALLPLSESWEGCPVTHTHPRPQTVVGQDHLRASCPPAVTPGEPRVRNRPFPICPPPEPLQGSRDMEPASLQGSPPLCSCPFFVTVQRGESRSAGNYPFFIGLTQNDASALVVWFCLDTNVNYSWTTVSQVIDVCQGLF